MTYIIKRWVCGLQKVYQWQRDATFIERLLILFTFAFLTGVSAQIFIKLPFTPVPITGQVLMVLLSGALLGKKQASLSQIIYLTGGMSGVPWFAGAKAGFLLPSFGYIIGFIPAAWFVGYFIEKKVKNFGSCILSMLIGIIPIYLLGAVWFSFIFGTGLRETMNLAVFPFIPLDIVKAYIAAYIAFYFFNIPHKYY
ncbi:MAG: biotin transporter BioY [bacterium]|nr:biotin transporter BioY [bacterium]